MLGDVIQLPADRLTLWRRFTVQNPVNDHRYSCKHNLMFPLCAMSRLVVTLQTHTHASKNGNF